MDIYLVRHAVAEERDAARWPDDSIRPSTAAGATVFIQAARGLRQLVPAVEVVLSSPYTRAWQTAQILHDECRWPSPQPCDALLPRPASDALELLARWGGSGPVALVGHGPHLPALAALLLAGPDAAVEVELEKGGAICLAYPSKPGADRAQLRWSVTPKILLALDRIG